MPLSRRDFGCLVAAGLPASLLPNTAQAAQRPRPDSTWGGIRVGMNAPYNFGTGNFTSGDDILSRLVQLGTSAVELRAQPVELFLGSPVALAAVASGRGARGGGGVPTGDTAADLRKWRSTVSLERVAAFRRTYEEAGVRIDVVKWDGIFTFSDDELDYAFTVSRALGARALSTEIGAGTDRVGRFADKHQMPIGYHGHAETGVADWERAFAQAKFNAANLDIGHFVFGQKTSPVPFLRKYSDRITHIHVKDRAADAAGTGVPFGRGATPIAEVLRLLRDNRWRDIQATIEFEYAVPDGSDRMAELAKCVDYCRTVLLGS